MKTEYLNLKQLVNFIRKAKIFRKICLTIFLLNLFNPNHAVAKERILIDDFSSAAAGTAVPKGWELKENKGKATLRIEEENGNKVLHLLSNKTSFALKKETEYNLEEYPILTWRWRAVTLPKGGDVRKKETDDQAGQIYLYFAGFPKALNFWIIGYIWDSLAPVGGTFPSPQVIGSRTQYQVLQSGTGKLNQWVTERRNLYEDHKKLFGKKPPSLSGIGILIDSNDTNTSAECYIDDIYLEKQ
ncbi:MAG: DUF3047 domain-containing protein [Candidatus Schekmanbacteria bacterium]|nr:DUF3047 domain-containing protein [Candidatus Schekmanbacteria bacterium]